MPLAHILAPQIAKKTAKIEQELAASRGAGYLQQRPLDLQIGPAQIREPLDLQIGPARIHEPLDLQLGPAQIRERPAGYLAAGNANAPATPPTASDLATKQLRADAAQRTPMGVFKNSARRAAMQADKNAKNLQFPVAPVEPPVEPTPTRDKRGRVMIPMGKPGEPVAVNERGEAIDSFGKNLGYLQQAGPMRTGVMTPADLHQNLTMAMRAGNPNAVKLLYKEYGKHLQEMQNNRDTDGMPTDKFPEGYFKGMSKAQRKNIEEGVRMLQEYERGVSA